MEIKEYMKQWRENNKERIKEKRREYYEKNKEKAIQYQKEYNKEYREKNKEKKKEYMKEYQKQYFKTENGKKSFMIGRWKNRGLTDTDLDYIYDLFKNTTNCWVCNCDFTKYKKCLDHDHETGIFRQILCNKCNVKDNWKNYSEWV